MKPGGLKLTAKRLAVDYAIPVYFSPVFLLPNMALLLSAPTGGSEQLQSRWIPWLDMG